MIFQALQTQELNPQKSPFCQMVLRVTQITPNTVQPQTSTAFQTPIRVNQIIKLTKDAYLEHWTNQTKTQNKPHCYLALNHEYKLSEYLLTVRDTKQRQILTKSRLKHTRSPGYQERKDSVVTIRQVIKYNHIRVEYSQTSQSWKT